MKKMVNVNHHDNSTQLKIAHHCHEMKILLEITFRGSLPQNIFQHLYLSASAHMKQSWREEPKIECSANNLSLSVIDCLSVKISTPCVFCILENQKQDSFPYVPWFTLIKQNISLTR